MIISPEKIVLLALGLGLVLPLASCDQVQDPGAVTAPEETIAKEDATTTVSLEPGSVKVDFPVTWVLNEEDNPYDLQYLAPDGDANMGIFLYGREDLAEEDGVQNLLNFHVEDLQSKRDNFTLVEPEITLDLEDKTITRVVYSGEKNGGKFYYQFSAIDFKDQNNQVPIVLAVSLPSKWTENKPVLEQIHRSFTNL